MEKKPIPENITTKNGLLYKDDRMIPLPEADIVAHEYGFMWAERMVKHLEGKQNAPNKSRS
jgi:hypothetical protein